MSDTCEQNTLTPRIFSHICTHFILVRMHRMAQGVARRVFIKERSSTCHHVSDRALSLRVLTSSFLSSVSTFCPFSSSPLPWSSSSMWSEPPSTRTLAHTQNEEYCTVAIQNPLTIRCRFRLECHLVIRSRWHVL